MHDRLVSAGGQGIRVRRLGGDRAGEIRLTRFLRNLMTLLTAGTESPSTRVAALDLLTADERTRMLDEWNATARPFPRRQRGVLVAEVADFAFGGTVLGLRLGALVEGACATI